MSQEFTALASEALKNNSEAFMQQAKDTLSAKLDQSQSDLQHRQEAVAALVKPIEEKLGQLEKSGRETYGGLREQIKNLVGTQGQLEGETRKLVQALRAPQVRGRWGEMTLRRAVELAGLVERCDFSEQRSLRGREDGRLSRPDMIVHLPSNRHIAVDAKTPLDAYLESIEADSDEDRNKALHRHARLLRERVSELSGKSYWDSLDGAPEFVVLFLPGEFFLGPALQVSPGLLEEAMDERIIVATPSTLISLLLAVAHGWREERLAENTKRIGELGREVHDRVAIWADHLVKLGNALDGAVSAFNESVGSLERRVLVSARRIKEQGISSEKDIPEIVPVDLAPRSLDVGQRQ
jgi:DNA recombination protein RmuC